MEERVRCPFDPVHVVERRRLQAHIIKCKRNLPPNHDFVECKYYHLHFVKRSQVDQHYAVCEHKLSKEANQRMWDSDASGFAPPNLHVTEHVQEWHYSEESWDIQTGPSFVRDQHKQKTQHMTVPEGLSKAKRKEHREKERERLRELEEKQPKIVPVKEQTIESEAEADVYFGPAPRKPDLQPTRGSCRIAAKFPKQLNPIIERSGSGSIATTLLPDGISSSYAKVARKHGPTDVNENELGRQFSLDQFPQL